MDIIQDPDDLRFYARVVDEEADLTYAYPEETVLDFDHNYILPKARNKGLADHLVQAGLEFTRENKL